MSRSLPCFCGYNCAQDCICEICHIIHMENETPLKKRIKSYLWRAAMMGITVGVASLLDNMDMLHLSPFWTTALGLLLGEVSKYLNTKK